MCYNIYNSLGKQLKQLLGNTKMKTLTTDERLLKGLVVSGLTMIQNFITEVKPAYKLLENGVEIEATLNKVEQEIIECYKLLDAREWEDLAYAIDCIESGEEMMELFDEDDEECCMLLETVKGFKYNDMLEIRFSNVV